MRITIYNKNSRSSVRVIRMGERLILFGFNNGELPPLQIPHKNRIRQNIFKQPVHSRLSAIYVFS